MFDKIFDTYMVAQPPKILPMLNEYGDFLTVETQLISDRSITTMGYETTGIMLLERLIGDADMKTILSYKDPFDRYVNGVLPIVNSLGRVFDPVVIGVTNLASFISMPSGKCQEYLFPVTTSEPFRDLPIGYGWDAWAGVRPLRLVDHDSSELTFHAYLDKLTFKIDSPTYAVLTLDCAALIMQYASYCEFTADEDPKPLLTNYLHRYVVQPALVEDGVDLWLRSRYLDEIKSGSVDPNYQDFVWQDATYGRIGSQYNRAMTDVVSMVTDVTKRVLTPQKFLSSLPMLNSLSLVDVCTTMRRTCTLPILRQYQCAAFLRDRTWLELTLRSAQLNRTLTSYPSMIRALQRDITLLNSAKPWTSITNTAVQNKVHQTILDLMNLIRS